VLTDFAKSRFSKMMVTRALTKTHDSLEEEANYFSGMLSGFAIQVENTLIKYGKNIIGNEYPQGRIANMATELYVMLALLSRTTSILNNADVDQKKKEYVSRLCKIAFYDSRRRF